MPHTFHIATYASHQLFGFQCNILPCGSIDRLGVAVSLNKLDTSPPSPALKAPPFWHVASSSEFRLYFAQQIFHSENSQIFSDPEQHLELVRWCQEACLHANNALIYTPQGRMASIWSNISVKRTIQKVNRPLQYTIYCFSGFLKRLLKQSGGMSFGPKVWLEHCPSTGSVISCNEIPAKVCPNTP